MAEDDDSKTEEPTSKRLTQAREEGDIVQSQEVKTAAILTAITLMVWFILPRAMEKIGASLSLLLSEPHMIRVGTEGELMSVMRGLGAHMALIMLVPLGFLLTVGVISSVAQTGWIISVNKITPDLNKINPLKGLSRIFSLPGLVEFIKNLAKLAFVAIMFYFVLRSRVRALPLLPSMDLPAILEFLHQVLIRLLCTIAAVDICIAAADYWFQYRTRMKKLRMTKQEIKD